MTAKLHRRKVNTSTPLGVKGFKPTSFDCDARTFRIIEEGYLVSISTTGKRVKVPMRVSNYHIGKLKGQNPTSAQVCKHRDHNFYVHIQLKSEVPKQKKTQNVIGVDFGRRDIAVTSTGESWSGKEINNTRDKYSRVRARLQNIASQGTRSTRRRCREILTLRLRSGSTPHFGYAQCSRSRGVETVIGTREEVSSLAQPQHFQFNH